MGKNRDRTETRILVIDGQGGGIGKALVTAMKKNMPDAYIIAVGTNTAATAGMLKAGANIAATGENAVKVNCRKCDYIIGPVGIAIADSLNGEITPAMALAIAQADAKRILIPFSQCDNEIVGVSDITAGRFVELAVEKILRDMQSYGA